MELEQSKQSKSIRLRRRDVLQLGAGGLAAAFSHGIGPVFAEQEPPGAPAQPPSGQPQQPTPPAVDTLIDPAAVLSESWMEPWVWRPEEWPGQPLELNVVQNQNPGAAPSPGNRFPSLFSFGGISPAPTIRMRGDGELLIRVRNMLEMNHGDTVLGPFPDPIDLTPELAREWWCRAATKAGLACDPKVRPPLPVLFDHLAELYALTGARTHPSHCMTEAANSAHATHVTNIHTHGLHVEPLQHPDGKAGDNVFLRILPRGDWLARQQAPDPGCRQLGHDERVAQIDYKYLPGDVMRAWRKQHGGAPQPQPPGTHWYHPHAHGSTHDQVSSGMAGFLILEGDVDAALNRALTGSEQADPEKKTGPFDYRERLMLIQRVEVQSTDFEARPRRDQPRLPPPTAVNGTFSPAVLFMRPGAVERWRILNGSVDGRGFKRFMVLEGHFVQDNNGHTWRVVPSSTDGAARQIVRVTRKDIERAKRTIYQLAFDGMTLVTVEGGRARYTIKDLSQQNAGTPDPLDREPNPGEHPYRAMLRNVEDCFRDGASIRNAFVRPNEVYLGNANRTDVFFKVPRDGGGRTYTIFAQEVLVHTDNFQQRLQQSIARGEDRSNPAPIDVVVGYVHVRGEGVEGGDLDVASLRDALPPVPPFLQPIAEDELRIPPGEALRRGVDAGGVRTRTISYSGYGGAEWPLIEVPEAFARAHPELEKRLWAVHDGTRVLLPPAARSMAVNGRFDLTQHPDPPPPRKFSHHDADGDVRAVVDTAEEWVLYNSSMMLWAHTDRKRFPQAGSWGPHYRSYPVSRAEGQARFARDPEFQITAKGVDHPFHIHINPCWVMRIDIPDEHGQLHNILEEPRWMDTVWIPRNGGRVVFRTRFADYPGRWVNHCHILMHEDHGMMQTVECTGEAETSNYVPRARPATSAMSAQEVNAIYPTPSVEIMYRQNLAFVDANPGSGQVFPGFDLTIPRLEPAVSSVRAERQDAGS